MGIQADDWTFGYVASWSDGGDAAVVAIKAAGTRIQRTAERIISALDLPDSGVAEPPGVDES